MSEAGPGVAAVHAARAPLERDVAILRRRAVDAARVPVAELPADVRPALLFELGDERYALFASRVLEVTALRDLMPLPGAPPPWFGVTQWRGDVLTILDLRSTLGVAIRGLTDLRRVIVVDAGRRRFGILADHTRDVIEVDVGRLRPYGSERGTAAGLVAGITDDAVLLIDADALVGLYMNPSEAT
jgi:purine-binding chemotaxis protein CheW